MTIIADTSYLFAVHYPKDINHQLASKFALDRASTMILVPDVVLPELAYLTVRDLGYAGLQAVLESLRLSDIELLPLQMIDLERVCEIVETYSTAQFDIVDCCIMAIAERLGVTRIATFDRRDFSIFRPQHCDFFELLPAA